MRGSDLFVVLIRLAGVLLLLASLGDIIAGLSWLTYGTSRDSREWIWLAPGLVSLLLGILFLRQAEWVADRFRWPESDVPPAVEAPLSVHAGKALVLHAAGLAALLLTVSPASALLREVTDDEHRFDVTRAWPVIAKIVIFSVIAFMALRRGGRAGIGASS